MAAGDRSSPARDEAMVVKRGGGLTSPAPRHSLNDLGSSSATLQVSPVRHNGESRHLDASRDDGDGTGDDSIGVEFMHYTVHILRHRSGWN
jgi:hypothetical protein